MVPTSRTIHSTRITINTTKLKIAATTTISLSRPYNQPTTKVHQIFDDETQPRKPKFPRRDDNNNIGRSSLHPPIIHSFIHMWRDRMETEAPKIDRQKILVSASIKTELLATTLHRYYCPYSDFKSSLAAKLWRNFGKLELMTCHSDAAEKV